MSLMYPFLIFSEKIYIEIFKFLDIFGHFLKYLKFSLIYVKIDFSNLTPRNYFEGILNLLRSFWNIFSNVTHQTKWKNLK